jgi:hypothetical protein
MVCVFSPERIAARNFFLKSSMGEVMSGQESVLNSSRLIGCTNGTRQSTSKRVGDPLATHKSKVQDPARSPITFQGLHLALLRG